MDNPSDKRSLDPDVRDALPPAGDCDDRDAREQVAEAAALEFLANLETESEDDVFAAAEFGVIVSALRQGSMGAVWSLIERYEPHIQRVVRRRLSHKLRSKFDTMDFVQMVWMSFFEDPDRLGGFDNPRQLFGFLAKMAQHKVDTELRRRTTQKYDVSKERPLEEVQSRAERPLDTPSQIAIARERWDDLLEKLPNHHREVVRLRLAGMTFQQISDKLSLDERTARRVLKALTSMLGEDG
ncbi:MAG: sigma-70 family RNA polymerase sigma factor [Planctomycetales bacterium]|nr:sigma-70 family RNA polymerase sigma factor [Planctomycetales bacterium]